MNDEELILRLQEFGIPKNECELYVGLLNTGPTKASHVCNFIQMNRVKGYKILENLQTLGLVSATFSSPTTYSANDIKESLQNLVNKKKFEITRLDKTANEIIEKYEARKVIEDFQADSYNIGTAITYLLRAGKKEGNPIIQDIQKAINHLNFELDRLNNEKKEYPRTGALISGGKL